MNVVHSEERVSREEFQSFRTPERCTEIKMQITNLYFKGCVEIELKIWSPCCAGSIVQKSYELYKLASFGNFVL